MASLSIAFGGGAVAPAATAASTRRLSRRSVLVGATSSKGGTGSVSSNVEEKGLLEWIIGGFQKDEQLLETDPILNKVEGKSSTSSVSSRKAPSAPPEKPAAGGGFNLGGLGGLFAKK